MPFPMCIYPRLPSLYYNAESLRLCLVIDEIYGRNSRNQLRCLGNCLSLLDQS